MYNHKVCTRCKIDKPLGEFAKKKVRKDGLSSWCLSCTRESKREWKKEHREQINAAARLYRANNLELTRAKSRERWARYPQEKRRVWAQKFITEHPEYDKFWKERNKEKVAIYMHKTTLKKLSTPEGKLNSNVSRGIRHSLNNNSKAGRHWEKLVGYTVVQLKEHLEKMFKYGMTWVNYGTYWHIDHKIPKTAFNFERPEDIDFRLCWALDNLQPLLAIENIKKSNKLKKPFQPALLIGFGYYGSQTQQQTRAAAPQQGMV